MSEPTMELTERTRLEGARIAAENSVHHLKRATDELVRRDLIPAGSLDDGGTPAELPALSAHLRFAWRTIGRVERELGPDGDGSASIDRMRVRAQRALDSLRAAWDLLNLQGLLPALHAEPAADPGTHAAALRRAFVRAQTNMVRLIVILADDE